MISRSNKAKKSNQASEKGRKLGGEFVLCEFITFNGLLAIKHAVPVRILNKRQALFA